MEKIYSPVENPGIIDLMIAPQPNHLAHQVAGIAADLGIKESTVKTYRNRAFDRLGIHFRSQLFALFSG